MKGEITIIGPEKGAFQRKLKVKSDGKLRKFKAKGMLVGMKDKQLVFKARSERPNLLRVLVRPDDQNLIVFDLPELILGEYKGTQVRHAASGRYTGWGCTFKLK